MDKVMSPLFEDKHHARICPVKPGEKRPLWSVIIPTHNCAKYLKETLSSVLRQDPGPKKMEIMVIDDCSTQDDPEAVVDEVGGGRVSFFRQDKNVGKVKNYEKGLQLSKGVFIHILHGDDLVRGGFYLKIESLFQKFSNAGVVFCQTQYIDENDKILGRSGEERKDDGLLNDWMYEIAVSQRIQTPSVVFRRSVFEKLGGYDRRLKYSEDWEMCVRASMFYDFVFTPVILAAYRVHSHSSTQLSMEKGGRIKPHRLVLRTIDGYLPLETRKRIKRDRNKAQAFYFVNFIPAVVKKKDWIGYRRYFINILMYSRHPKVISRLLRFTLFYKKYCK